MSLAAAAVLLLCVGANAQSPRVLYTWDGAASIEDWIRSFGTNTATLNNSTVGQLTLIETGSAGSDVAFSDGFNRIVESSTASGGLDLTGLDYLEFDLGHNGSGPVNVQFYVQASTGSNFLALGPDVAVMPGMNTYQVPLPAMTYAQQAYVRTVGFNVRTHTALGNLTWTLDEVRSAGTSLIQRELVNHNIGSSENGLQGAIANFDSPRYKATTVVRIRRVWFITPVVLVRCNGSTWGAATVLQSPGAMALHGMATRSTSG